MADPAVPNIGAHISTLGPDGMQTPRDPAGEPATNVQVKFRQAWGDVVPTAVHAYIDITRANGLHQTIAAYPVGGAPITREGAQLTFEAGEEKKQITEAEFELRVPKGMTLTQYANDLVNGAKAYNAHAQRYDMIGEDGVNSNSFVSSLIVAKGGATGIGDVKAIASVIDTSPVRTVGQAATMNDRQMAELVRRDDDSGRLVCAGFGHAATEPARFTSGRLPDTVAPRADSYGSNLPAAVPSALTELGIRAAKWESEIEQPHDSPQGHGATVPYMPGGTMHVHYAGKDREFGPGYRQSGTITSVSDGIVTQRFGRQTAQYQMSDLTADARDPAAMERLIVPGRYLEVSIGRERVHVTSLEREHDIDRAQQHGLDHGR